MSKTILLNQNWIFSKEGHDEPVTLPHTWNAVDGMDGNGSYLRKKGNVLLDSLKKVFAVRENGKVVIY